MAKPIIHEGLCRTSYCPAPSSPDWHYCIICRSPKIEHHHTESIGMGGSKSRRMNKRVVVPLCTAHHDQMSLNKYTDKVEDGYYIVTNKRGNVIVKEPYGDSEKRIVEDDASAPMAVPVGGVRGDDSPTDSLVGSGGDIGRDGGLTYAEYEAEAERIASAYHSLGGIKSAVTWEIGDFLLRAEKTLGERSSQLEDKFKLDGGRLQNIVTVCERVHPLRRRGELSFEVHAVVYPLPDEEQSYWLTRAATEALSSRKLRAAIREAQGIVKAPPVYRCPECGHSGVRKEFAG